jgi:hypothetical protein
MNLRIFNDFIEKFDKPGAVVLLEGKRNVKPEDEEKLIRVGKLLAANSSHITFRSGNAPGADELFSQGVCSVNPARMEVITPYTDHRNKTNHAGTTYSLDEINIVNEPQIIYQSKANKKNAGLIDQYANGAANASAQKGAYIIRDTVKVIGTKDIPKATFGIFYIDTAQPESGGTGHTMMVCKNNGVMLITQTTWFHWLI